MKKISIFVALVIAFATCLPMSGAEAAPGDLLFELGNDYDFRNPQLIAADDSGQVYVTANDGNNLVRVFDRNGNFLFQWGGKGGKDGQFQSPVGIDVDESSSQVYVADMGNKRIQVFDRAGNFLFKWDCYSSGDGQRYYPWAIAVDESGGQVYVTDYTNHLVQVYDLAGNFLFKWGEHGYSGEGHFNHIRGIAVDEGSGNVYVSDHGNLRIQVFDRAGNFLFQWGGRGRGDGKFDYPMGIAVDASNGRVYVTELVFVHRVQVFDLAGNFLFKFGEGGGGDGQFRSSYGIAVDNNGQVYVADTGNGRIQVFDYDGTFIAKWKGIGYGDEQILSPQAIDIDSDDNVYVSSKGIQILAFDRNGNFLFQLGRSYRQAWNSCGTGDGEFCGITDIFVDDSSSRIYVVDGGNQRIQVFDRAGNFLFKWGDGGSGDGQFVQPSAIAVDEGGLVYIADTRNHRIQVFDQDGNFQFEWGSYGSGNGQFTSPQDIVIDESSGQVYVTERFPNCRVQVFDLAGNFLFKWGGFGPGHPGYFYYAEGIAADNSGNIFVRDNWTHDIQVFDRTGNFITSWNGTYGGRIAIDSRGRIYAVDRDYARILVYEGVIPSNQAPTAAAGPDREIECATSAGTPVLLGGSASFDPDGDQLTYTWSGPFGTVNGANPTVTLSLGAHIVTLTVDDGNGGTDFDEVVITVVDTRPPSTSIVVSGTAGNNGWYVSPVSLRLIATDSCSGVSSLSYSVNGTSYSVNAASVTINLDEGLNVVSYYAVDAAGNVEDSKQLLVSIDLTDPVITITGVEEGAVYPVCELPAASYNAIDTLSGLAASSTSNTKNAETGLVSYTYSVTASDTAGNTTTAEVAYEVVEGAGGVTVLMQRYLASGLIAAQMENSLLAQLQNTQDLQAFMNHVQAQSGKKIDPVATDMLINSAACIN